MKVSRCLAALMAKGSTAPHISGYPPGLIQGGGKVVRHLLTYPDVDPSEVQELFGPNRLSEGRRQKGDPQALDKAGA